MDSNIKKLTNEQKRLHWNRGCVDDQFKGPQPYGSIIKLENIYIDGAKPIIETQFDREDLPQLYSYFTERLEAANILSDDYYAGPMTWDDPRYLAGFITTLFYGIEWKEKRSQRIDDTINVADIWHYFCGYDALYGRSICYGYSVTDKDIIDCYYSLKTLPEARKC